MNANTMKSLAAAAVLAVTAGTGLAAGNGVALTDAVEKQIRAILTEQGYEVRKIKTEDGFYEAYARKDGQRFELYLDADLNVVKTKADD